MPTDLEKLEARITELEDWLFKTHASGRLPAATRIDRLEVAYKAMGKRWALIGSGVVAVIATVLGYLITRGS